MTFPANIIDAIAAITHLHLLRPWWLLLLLALPAIGWTWQRRRARGSVWTGVVDAHLLPHLVEARTAPRQQAALWIGMLAYALAVCALAGPSWSRVDQPLLQGRAPLVIALDLSSAVMANDLPPSRLLQARAKIATLLARRDGGQVGLVVYADDAFTVAPLTDDAANVALFLDALEPNVMPVDGSRGEQAIAWSVKLLKRAGFDRGDIVLVSDHASNAARAAAATAARDGFRVSALGLGTAAGAAYQAPDGSIGRSQLDAASLQALARSGDGRYSALTADTHDLAILGLLKPADADAVAARGEKTSVWQDQGYWLLLPLMLLALLAFRRGGALAAVLLCVVLPLAPLSVHAAEKGTVWQRADQVEHARMGQGIADYRKGEFDKARAAFGDLPGADAAYNDGNALAKAGQYPEAIAAYDRALKAKPGMPDALANKQAVEAAMKRKPPPGGGSKDPKDGKDKQGKQDKSQDGKDGKGADGKPGDKQDGKDGQPPQDAGQSPSGKDGSPDKPGSQDKARNEGNKGNQDRPNKQGQPPAGTPSTPPQPAETPAQAQQRAQAQAKADAAQRARMAQATQAGSAAKPPVPQAATKTPGTAAEQAAANETQAEREQRQANAAWLRRVPDDPGGLLRAKFRLEQERRMESGIP